MQSLFPLTSPSFAISKIHVVIIEPCFETSLFPINIMYGSFILRHFFRVCFIYIVKSLGWFELYI